MITGLHCLQFFLHLRALLWKNCFARLIEITTIFKMLKNLVKQHYENMPMQHTVINHDCKNDNFQKKNCDVFLIVAQNIDCGYTLEPPH